LYIIPRIASCAGGLWLSSIIIAAALFAAITDCRSEKCRTNSHVGFRSVIPNKTRLTHRMTLWNRALKRRQYSITGSPTPFYISGGSHHPQKKRQHHHGLQQVVWWIKDARSQHATGLLIWFQSMEYWVRTTDGNRTSF
jgi:hypothetical protein